MTTNAEVDQMVQALHAINDGRDESCPHTAPVDLYGWARQAAVVELLQSWRDGLLDGATLSTLIADVDAVIDELHVFKRAVVLRFGLDYMEERP